MTGILFASGLLAAILGSFGLLLYEANQARACTWREAAKAVGLAGVVEERGFLGFHKGLRGHVGAFRVHIESYGSGRPVAGTRVLISGLGHALYPPFHLRAEGVSTALAKAFGERELEIGDERFDRAAYIRGSMPTVLAILDAETRRLLMGLLQGGVATGESSPAEALRARVDVVDGTLRAEFPEPTARPAVGNLPGAVSHLVALARRLASPEDLAQRLAANVMKDPVAGVRLANLVALVEHHANEDVTRQALRAAYEDADDEVRLRAAIALGAEARDVLMKTASDPVGWPVPLFSDGGADSRAARAIEALGPSLTASEAGEILRRSVDGTRFKAARAAIDVLGRIGGADAISALCSALESNDTDVACAAARALGAAGGDATETALIAALKREAPLVQRAASAALGRCGSAAAVKPLLAVDGPFNLGATARQAIAQIQSRLSGAARGQLALAEGDAGQLSLAADAVEGRVSLALEQEGVAADEIGADGETQWPTDRSPAEGDASPGTQLPRPPRGEAE